MTWLALSLYALGVVGAFSLIPRDVPAGLRENIVIIAWPLAVAAAICLGLFTSVRRLAGQ